MKSTHTALAILAVATACLAPSSRVAPMPSTRDAWSAMTWEDRHDVMTFAVLPNMARAFQRFRQAADPDMTCRTCHGADAEAVHYAMPHGLPALDPDRMPDRNSPNPREAKMAAFMIDEVTPAMADLLGITEAAPNAVRPDENRGGPRSFSCFNCHPAQAAKR